MTEDDEELKKLDDELKRLEGIGSSYGSPEPAKKDNLFKFFREILISEDSRKVANLSMAELGITKLGVRSLLDVANYADVENLPVVADFIRNKAEVVLATSMSKKGFWAQLLVTQIKKELKMDKPKEVKKSFFSKKGAEG